jgi:hypothetical protein
MIASATAAWLIGISFLVVSTNAPRALEFSRHSADSSGLNAIAATGRIEAGDAEKLLSYLRTLPGKPNTAIYLSSPGGSLIEGLKLGYLFKEMRIKTVVEGGVTARREQFFLDAGATNLDWTKVR